MSLFKRPGPIARSVREIALPCAHIPRPACSRSFSGLNRPSPKYPHHVPLGFFEKGFLAIGSAVGALLNPRRAGQSESTEEKKEKEKVLS